MGQATIGCYEIWALEQTINKQRKRMLKKAMGFRKKFVNLPNNDRPASQVV